MKKTVIIIDDSQISCVFLKNLFQEEGWDVMGTFLSLSAALDTISHEKPQLISLDYNFEKNKAVSQFERFKKILSISEILFITEDGNIRNLILMYESSACGIGSKGNMESLKKIVRSTSKGIRCYDQDISNKLLQYHIDGKPLTSQEKKTFVGLMSGQTIDAVAEQLNISDRTVWKHRRKIIVKIGRDIFSQSCSHMIVN